MAGARQNISGVRIAAVVLAAGRSTRFPQANKLILPCGDTSIVGTSVQTVLDAGVSDVFVVVGYDADTVMTALSKVGVQIVANPNYAMGMGTSIVAGVRAAGESYDGYLVCLGDMPLIRVSTLLRVMETFTSSPSQSESIVRPSFRGHEGHPVLLGSGHYASLCELSEDRGARSVINASSSTLQLVEVFDTGVFSDIDSMEDYRRLVEEG
jgi:molybdenum cofactor cytidylyltransferase